jgi:hypothetical protein
MCHVASSSSSVAIGLKADWRIFVGSSHPDVSCSSLSNAYATWLCLTWEATYHLCKQVRVLENYRQFGIFRVRCRHRSSKTCI